MSAIYFTPTDAGGAPVQVMMLVIGAASSAMCVYGITRVNGRVVQRGWQAFDAARNHAEGEMWSGCGMLAAGCPLTERVLAHCIQPAPDYNCGGLV